MDNKKIKITIVSGFLGSGKTTFLNQYMNKIFEESNQVALIVNEFGRFDVDSHIMNQTALSVSMLQGCICCDLQDDLVMQLHQLSKQEVQHVVIEATGIANPIELLSACQDPIISNVYEAPLVITIVDSKRLLQNENTEATETLMDDQIRASHRLILNKIDLLNSDEARQEVIQYVSQLAPYSQIDLAIYGEVKESVKHGQATIDKVNLSTSHPHTHYEVLSYDFTHPISHEQLVQFILNMPDSILRMKGYVQFREFPNEIYLLQYSGGLPALESMGDMKLPTTVVLIGEKLDKPALKNKLELLQFG